MRRWLLFWAGISMLGGQIPLEARSKEMISRISYRGWKDAYLMTNGRVRLVVVPAIGGRIMEYSWDGKNAIFENPAEFGKLYPQQNQVWYNYGGYKTWNSPADRWKPVGWPPDPALDYGPANIEVTGPNSLRIIGSPSFAAGLLFIKDITMDPSTGEITLVQRMRNITSQSIEWGVWDVTQVKTPCFVVFPVNVKSRFPNGLLFMIEGSEKSKQWAVEDKLCVVQYGREAGKIGSDVSEGWMVYFQDRLAYIKRFPPLIEGALYPDQGALAQVFTSGGKPDYIEMEVLSPIFRLKPGEEGSLTEQWILGWLPRPVKTRADIPLALKTLRIRS